MFREFSVIAWLLWNARDFWRRSWWRVAASPRRSPPRGTLLFCCFGTMCMRESTHLRMFLVGLLHCCDQVGQRYQIPLEDVWIGPFQVGDGGAGAAAAAPLAGGCPSLFGRRQWLAWACLLSACSVYPCDRVRWVFALQQESSAYPARVCCDKVGCRQGGLVLALAVCCDARAVLRWWWWITRSLIAVDSSASSCVSLHAVGLTAVFCFCAGSLWAEETQVLEDRSKRTPAGGEWTDGRPRNTKQDIFFLVVFFPSPVRSFFVVWVTAARDGRTTRVAKKASRLCRSLATWQLKAKALMSLPSCARAAPKKMARLVHAPHRWALPANRPLWGSVFFSS